MPELDDLDDDDDQPDLDAQLREHDPDGDPDAADPGACEPYAEDDPPGVEVWDALDDLDDDDPGDVDLCAPLDETEA
jgi:hypothetical protein